MTDKNNLSYLITEEDVVNKPKHYLTYSIECIEITKHMPFCLGNAVKYLYRHANKGKQIEDINKALVYLRWAQNNNDQELVQFRTDVSQNIETISEETIDINENIALALFYIARIVNIQNYVDVSVYYSNAERYCRQYIESKQVD